MHKKESHWIISRLSQFKDNIALIWQDQQYSYDNVVQLIQHWLQVLENLQVSPGEIIAMQGDYSPNTCALLFALLINQNIVVPLATNNQENTEKFLNIAQVQTLFEFTSQDHYAVHRREVSITHPLLIELKKETNPGLILFSSGSTGESKATVLNMDQLLKKFQKLRKGYRTLVFLLLDHIGGINTLLHVLTQGGTLITTHDRHPRHICQLVESYKVELLPTTPTFLNVMLMSGLHESHDLSSLKLVTYGTEPMPVATLKELNRLFPAIQFKQTYGLSELGVLPTKSEAVDSLWLMLGGEGVQYKIQDGMLFIKTDTAMLGYLNAPSPFDHEGWFVTGDMVETKIINDQEYLRILGRKSEMINVGGEKVYPIEVENVLLQIPNVIDAVVNSKKNPITGQVVVAKVRLAMHEDLKEFQARAREYCKGKLAPYKVPVLIEVAQELFHGERFKRNRRQFA